MISSINVTPLVDVMLVLLVIFMIAAPVIYQSAIQVELPNAVTGEKTDQSKLQFTLPKDGGVYWGSEALDWTALDRRLGQLSETDRNETAAINADEGTPHGNVVKLMDALRKYGVTRFAMTVDQQSK